MDTNVHIVGRPVLSRLGEEMDIYGRVGHLMEMEWPHVMSRRVHIMLCGGRHKRVEATSMGNDEPTVRIRCPRIAAPEADMALEVFVQVGQNDARQPAVISRQELRPRGGPKFAGHQVRTRLGLYL